MNAWVGLRASPTSPPHLPPISYSTVALYELMECTTIGRGLEHPTHGATVFWLYHQLFGFFKAMSHLPSYPQAYTYVNLSSATTYARDGLS